MGSKTQLLRKGEKSKVFAAWGPPTHAIEGALEEAVTVQGQAVEKWSKE